MAPTTCACPLIVSEYCRMYDCAGVANNQLELAIDACLDDGDDVIDDTYTVPVYIDTGAPASLFANSFLLILGFPAAGHENVRRHTVAAGGERGE